MYKKKLSLYIFGTGEMAKILLPTLRLSMCEIIAFVEERPDNWNTQYMSRPIIGPQDVRIEQCDYLLIFCYGAKGIAKKLTEEHAIPKDKIVPMDILEMNSINGAKKIGQKKRSHALKMYLSSFPRLFDIIDMDIIKSNVLLRDWLANQYHIHTLPPRSKVRYCSDLLGALVFEPGVIHPCCDARPLQKPSYIYSGQPFDIVTYREKVNESIKVLQFDTHLCENCPKLIETDKSLTELYVEQFDFKFICFNQHRFFCNCKCVYCGFWQTPANTQPYLVLDTLKKLVHTGMVNKNCLFHWGGGEPTILKEFEEIASWVASQGYFQTVFTSGIKISPIVISMLEAGICNVLISLDSGSRAIYKKVKNVDEWDNVIKTCATYCAHGTKNDSVVLKYIIFDENNDFSEISRFLHLCVEMGVTYVSYSLELRELYPQSTSQQTVNAAAFFIQQARQMGLISIPIHVYEPFLSQINELASSM